MADFKTCVYVTDQDGEEHEIDVRIEYDAVYQPARLSGPPEDCYPEESSMDLTKVEVIGDLPEGITYGMVVVASMADDERLTDEAWEHYHSRGVDDDR